MSEQKPTVAEAINAAADHGPSAVAISGGDSSLGLTGWWKLVGNMSAVVVIAGSFLFLQWTIVHDLRGDRLEDRTSFRESLTNLNAEENRRAGELKGALDKNTEVMRELMTEMKSWKREAAKAARPPE